jgi:hypothetical protein
VDVDIDLVDRDVLLARIPHRIASLRQGVKHNTGVYATEIPHNPVDNTATIDYKTAESRGYFKIDLLNVSVYKGVRNEQHLVDLLNAPPLWDLLQYDEFVDQLFHLNSHGAIVRQNLPTSLDQLAAVLAMIRPSKRYLIGKSWDQIFLEVWKKPEDGLYYWKKSHAYAYAAAVVVQMNLICEQAAKESASPTECSCASHV